MPQEGERFPDLCRPLNLLTVFLLAELIVVIPTLAPDGLRRFEWRDFALVSLFAQVLALWIAASLCALRPRLERLPRYVAPALAWLLVVLIAAAGTFAALWLDEVLRLRTVHPAPGGRETLAATVGITALVAAAALRYFYLQLAWRRQVEAAANARLQALQARIRPHFLFNALNSIASLTRRDPQAAEAAIEDLADLFRATLDERGGDWRLADELEACRRYVAIETLRLGNRLTVAWQVEALPPAARLPALVLQPLVENAIQHGVQRLRAGGTVTVFGTRPAPGLAAITVTNPRPGPGRGGRDAGDGAGQALANIRQRLMLRFGGRATIHADATATQFRATLTWPIECPTAGEEPHEGPDRR